MSSNMNASFKSQEVAPVFHPDHTVIPIPLPPAPPDDSMVGGGPPNGPAILPPIPQPAFDPSTATSSDLAELIASQGVPAGITAAVLWHRVNSQPDPLTHDELSRSVAKKTITEDYIDLFHQDLPNTLALRLLAPSPRQSYDFEDRSTTNENETRKLRYKCLAPSCTFVGKGKGRHMADQHVQDIDGAICCPYKGCKQIYYKSRVSQMTKHFTWHEAQNRKRRLRGKAITPLSSFQSGVRGIGNMIM